MHEVTIAPAITDNHLGSFLATYRSASTRRAYHADMKQWFAFLDQWSVSITDATHRHVALYFEMVSAHLSPATSNRRIAAVRAYYDHLIRLDVVTVNPAKIVKLHRMEKISETPALTVDEVKALLTTAKSHSPRAYALVAVLLHTGARISEILSATVSDLGHESGFTTLTVTRKGGKRQKLVLNESAWSALDAYLNTSTSEDALVKFYNRPIFTTSTGNAMDAPAAFRLLDALSKKADIKHVSAHVLRATHATLALEAGVPIHHLQDSLGHASMDTTQRYNKARNRLKNSSANTLASMF